MQLIGTYGILGLLGYVAVLIGREQLGAYGGVNYVKQDIVDCVLTAEFIAGSLAYQRAYQSLGNAHVHAIH